MKPPKRPPHHKPHRPTPKGPAPQQKQTHWGGVADWYDGLVGEEGSEYHRHVVFPGVLKLLRLQPGQCVLDVACGQGAFSRLLHSKGALVTGVDAAQQLIDHARQRNANLPPTPEAPKYFVGDARNLNFLPHDHFDSAACLLAIQNIDKLPPVFAGVARALKLNGSFVLVMMHPVFRGPKFTHWGWDEEAKTQYRRIDRYLLPRKDPIFTHPGKKTGEYTWSFHRPVQSYVKALRGAGLLVDAIDEWPSHKVSEPGPRAAGENTARKEIPMFMAVRAVKVGTGSGTSAEDQDGTEVE
jgi:ubiquinone/menaquinone biosynthesis C-methylase UbiE